MLLKIAFEEIPLAIVYKCTWQEEAEEQKRFGFSKTT
jgi:hypothetical protein